MRMQSSGLQLWGFGTPDCKGPAKEVQRPQGLDVPILDSTAAKEAKKGSPWSCPRVRESLVYPVRVLLPQQVVS